MLLLFNIGEERYGVDVSQVLEVLPFLKLTPIRKTPAYVAGVANCRGQLIPVLDISRMYTKKSAPNRLSTRIILVRQTLADDKKHVLGILAERVTDAVRIDNMMQASPYEKENKSMLLGQELIMVDEQIIQRVNADELLPSYLHKRLFHLNTPTKPHDAGNECH